MHPTRLLFLLATLFASQSAARLLPPQKNPNGVADFRNGVVTYPVVKGMGFNGPWQVFREWRGPRLFADDGFMRFEAQKTDEADAYRGRGRWTYVDLDPRLSSDGGAVVFKLRLNNMDGLEAQMSVLANLVLRIRDKGRIVEWARWTGTEFVKLGESRLRAGDSAWHQVMILTTANGFTLIENGKMVFNLEKRLGEFVPQTFHMSRMSPDTSFSLDLGDIVCIPGPAASQT